MISTYGELMDEGQAAVVLKVSPRTLQAWRVRGCGPTFIKVGRLVRYRLKDLQELVNENVHQSTSRKCSRLEPFLLLN